MWTQATFSGAFDNANNVVSYFRPQISNFTSTSLEPTTIIKCNVCHCFESIFPHDRLLRCSYCGNYFHHCCGSNGCTLQCKQWKDFSQPFNEIVEDFAEDNIFIDSHTLCPESNVSLSFVAHCLDMSQQTKCDDTPIKNILSPCGDDNSHKNSNSDIQPQRSNTPSNITDRSDSSVSKQSDSKSLVGSAMLSHPHPQVSNCIHPCRSSNRTNRRRGFSKKRDLYRSTVALQVCPSPEMMLKVKDVLRRKRMKQKTLASLLKVSESTVSKYLHGAERTTGWSPFEQKLQHVIELYIE
jgi:hypothetical protein